MLLVVTIAVVTLAMASGVRVRRETMIVSGMQLAGAARLLVTVLTHVSEAWLLWPGMGWGKPQSADHYVDLASASVGLSLVGAS